MTRLHTAYNHKEIQKAGNRDRVQLRALGWIVVLNILLRGAWLLCMHPPQQYDFLWYYTHAISMLNNQGYTMYNHYTAYWPIGYPFFLMLLFRITGPSQITGLIANAVLSICVVLLIYALAMRVFHRPRVAVASALFYTLLPSQIEWNAVLGSETLFTCLMMLSLLLYLMASEKQQGSRVLLVVIAGIALGLGCDVRPIPLLFPVLLMLYERFVRGSSWKTSIFWPLLLLICAIVAIAPVTIRNEIALQHFVLISTNGGVNLWQGTMVNGSYFWSWNPKINPLVTAGTNQILENQIGMHVAIQTIIHHPLRTVMNGFIKIFFLYWVDWNVVSVTVATLPKASPVLIKIFMWGNTIVYWVWMMFAIAGIRHTTRLGTEERVKLALPLAFILYNTAVFFFFPAWDRFRYPLMPCFALLVGWGWWCLRHRTLPR